MNDILKEWVRGLLKDNRICDSFAPLLAKCKEEGEVARILFHAQGIEWLVDNAKGGRGIPSSSDFVDALWDYVNQDEGFLNEGGYTTRFYAKYEPQGTQVVNDTIVVVYDSKMNLKLSERSVTHLIVMGNSVLDLRIDPLAMVTLEVVGKDAIVNVVENEGKLTRK